VDARNAKGRRDEGLRSLVEAELARVGKLTVVIREADRRRLRKLKKQSHALSRQEEQRCEPGQEVSANSVLVAKRIKTGKGKRLFVGLQAIEAGCQAASVSVRWSRKRPERAVAEAVAALLAKLRRQRIQLPGRAGEARPRVREGTIREEGAAAWRP